MKWNFSCPFRGLGALADGHECLKKLRLGDPVSVRQLTDLTASIMNKMKKKGISNDE